MVAVVFVGCQTTINEPTVSKGPLDDLNVPDGFAYQTTDVTSGFDVTFKDVSGKIQPNVPMQIALDENGENVLFETVSDENGQFKMDFTIPTFAEEVFIRTERGVFNVDLTTPKQTFELQSTEGGRQSGIIDNFFDQEDNRNFAYFPGKNRWGSFAYEDLWPCKGDYDFNDLVLNYKIQVEYDRFFRITHMWFHYRIMNNGTSHFNGAAIRLPFNYDRVKTVTGSKIRLTEDFINLRETTPGLNTEVGDPYAVIVLFDNADAKKPKFSTLNDHGYYEGDVHLTFNPAIYIWEILGKFPLDPFIFGTTGLDGEIQAKGRSTEVHLPGLPPTVLANDSYFGTCDDASGQYMYYMTSDGLPWALHTPYPFNWPRENISILRKYPHFKEWVESRGKMFPDWYKWPE